MKRLVLSAQFFTLIIFSWLLGLGTAHDMLRKHLLGHGGYIAYQNQYYDKYIAGFSHSWVHTFTYGAFFAGALAFYELLALGVEKVFSFIRRSND